MKTSTGMSSGLGIGIGGGRLHELRKKTMQKIVQYASVAPSASASSSPVASSLISSISPRQSPVRRTVLTPHSSIVASNDRMRAKIKRFEEHAALAQDLHAQLTEMLLQLRAACAGMTQVAETFTQLVRPNESARAVGLAFLSEMLLLRHDRADILDQAMRFTVLDPLAAVLERHTDCAAPIAQWLRQQEAYERMRIELETLRVSHPTAVQRHRELDDQLTAQSMQLHALEPSLTAMLDEATDERTIANEGDLFAAMRLQLAIFFFHANRSLFSRLTATEAEIVQDVGPVPAPTSPSISSATPCSTPQCSNSTSVVAPLDAICEASSSIDTRDARDDGDNDDLRVTTTTLEGFENGIGAAFESEDAEGMMLIEPSPSIVDPEVTMPTQQIDDLLALATNPVVEAASSSPEDADDAAPRSLDKATQQSHSHADSIKRSGVFSSIRKSLNETFGSPRGASSSKAPAPSATTATATATSAPTTGKDESTTLPTAVSESTSLQLSSSEWCGVEASLWALDASDALNCLDQRTCSPQEGPSSVISHILCAHLPILQTCAGFLRLEDIARLAKVDRALHTTLQHDAAIWRHAIRTGGLSPSIRSAVWLAGLYGTTSWKRTATSVPPHLQTSASRKRIYEHLLVQLGARIADGLLAPRDGTSVTTSSSLSKDDHQLIAWLHEIDVDVVRTCNKDIYAADVAEEWDACFEDSARSHQVTSQNTRAASSQREKDPSSSARATRRKQLEAKIRRVLRAYIMYNPRVGYCQGMNFLVRLLMEVATDEADCFWLFVGLSEPENDRNLYEPGLAVLQPLFAQFEACLGKLKPELLAHFHAQGVPVAAFTARWFLTFFSTFETFGPRVVIHLLDLFLIDGWRIIFSYALVVLDQLEHALKTADLEGILRMLQFPRMHLVEPDATRRQHLVRHALAYSITTAMHESLETGRLASL